MKIWFLFFPFAMFAQNFHLDAYSRGLANNIILKGTGKSAFGHTASLIDNQTRWSLGATNLYAISSWYDLHLSFSKSSKTKNISTGVSLQKRTRFYRFQGLFSMAIQLNEKYAISGALIPDFSYVQATYPYRVFRMFARLSGQFSNGENYVFGASVFSDLSGKSLIGAFELMTQIDLSSSWNILASITQTTRYTEMKSAFRYVVKKRFYLAIGFGTGPSVFSISLMFNKNGFLYALANSIHSVLGASSHIFIQKFKFNEMD